MNFSLRDSNVGSILFSLLFTLSINEFNNILNKFPYNIQEYLKQYYKENLMNSIAKALNNIAQSLQAIATAILSSKRIDVRPTVTSNPTSNTIVSKLQKY